MGAWKTLVTIPAADLTTSYNAQARDTFLNRIQTLYLLNHTGQTCIVSFDAGVNDHLAIPTCTGIIVDESDLQNAVAVRLAEGVAVGDFFISKETRDK